MEYKKSDCEYFRHIARNRFSTVKETWIDLLRWMAPWRAKWLLAQTPGARTNQHIVDPTHIISQRSYVAGFLEGNTSSSRPWFKHQAKDDDINKNKKVKEWIQGFTQRCVHNLSQSNFYHEAGQFYYDYSGVATGAHFIDEFKGGFHWHTMVPGSYYSICNSLGEHIILVREYCLTVKAIVDRYGKKSKGGMPDWSNISSRVRKLYEVGNYTTEIDIVQLVKENEFFSPTDIQGGRNRKWVAYTYETGGSNGFAATDAAGMQDMNRDEAYETTFLEVKYSKRKPFVIGAGPRNSNFEWGEQCPAYDALGLIKSLNKKAIGKDQALEHMLKPPLQGPASLRKSYISSQPNTYVPVDAQSLQKGGLRPVFEINPAIGSLIQDVTDLRQMVDKIFYADYLLYLSKNPKTRTAAETNAIVQEQQLVIGPNLQSLNWTYNQPIVDFVSDWTLDNDPWILTNPPPDELQGTFLKTEFISVFAIAQKAADLPSIERYIQKMLEIAPIDPQALQKVNLDKLSDIYEDRLYLPVGLNRPQSEVDSMRQQAQAQAERHQQLTEQLPAVAGAAKDLGTLQDKQQS
jgi:hypothetical protein